ncbi:MAG: hypothetical protein WCJ98_10340 [Mycobacteriaceae bacterium]
MWCREYSGSPGLAAAAVGAVAVGVAIAVASPALLPEASAAPAGPTSDELGYVGSAARCDDTQTLMAYGRTARALVVICVDPDGQLEYRGVRISDQAALSMAAARASSGTIIATNDGVTYVVSPTMLLVSEGDTVLYRDSWADFHQPRFSAGSTNTTPTTTPTSSTTPTPSSTTTATSSTTPTVSTTTVTPTPKSGG